MRHFAFMASIDNPDAEQRKKAIGKIPAPIKENGRSFRGFNPCLDTDDYQLFLTLYAWTPMDYLRISST